MFKNKLANVTYIFSLIVVLVISFFIYLSFFSNISGGIVSETDDLLCRSLIAGKDFSKAGMGIFFYELSNRCKIDVIGKYDKLDLREENKSFKIISDEMKRCWYRYGEGKYDFLSEWDSEGKWCFICGSISLEENNHKVSFNKLIKWTKNNKLELTNGSSKSYYDYINLKHVDVSDSEIEDIKNEYFELVNDPDLGEEMKPTLYALGNQLEYFLDLKNKEINDKDEKIYVVYNFNRVNQTFDEQLSDASDVATYGVFGGILLTLGAEMAIEAAAMGTGGAIIGSVVPGAGTAAGGIIGGVGGGIYGFFKGTWKIIKGSKKLYENTKKMVEIKKLMAKMKSLTSGSKDKFSSSLVKITTYSGKKIEVFNKVLNFKGSLKDLKKTAELIRESNKAKAENLDEIIDIMDNLEVNSLDDIGGKLVTKKDKLIELEKKLDKTSDSKVFDDLFEEYEALDLDINDLEGLRDISIDEITQLKNGVSIETPALKQMLKLSALSATGALGLYVLSENNDNEFQYVNLLSREQYYRSCGTQRFE